MILSGRLHPTRAMQKRTRVQRFGLSMETVKSFDTMWLIFSYRGIPNNVMNRKIIFLGGNHRTNPDQFVAERSAISVPVDVAWSK